MWEPDSDKYQEKTTVLSAANNTPKLKRAPPRDLEKREGISKDTNQPEYISKLALIPTCWY